jgi:EAL domain-containing protein (putative c-di-GMP-specific phosphodiesterase class I)/ActR/RegA family two-component response regulator
MHLLVLDDERGISALFCIVARDRGWTAESAVTEKEFQELYSAHRPDVVVMDLQLGKTDGIEQLRFLGGDHFTGALILISGFDARVLDAARNLGLAQGLNIAAALAKPIRIPQLRELLEKIEKGIAVEMPDLPVNDLPGGPAVRDEIQAATVSQALQSGQMELYLQPIVSAKNRRVLHLEAMMRWNHPVLGMLLPEKFIPVAEADPATIDALTMWTIRAAAEQCSHLTLEGHILTIAVNISGANLQALDFPDRVEALIKECAAPPDALSFEVTENVAMNNPQATTDILARLRLKGFTLALDDFGAGHSSLKVLRQMPFSTIKIDQSFIHDLITSEESLAIVKSVVELARALNVDVIAEGVETKEAAHLLKNLGVTGLQGYYFGPPLPLNRTLSWLNAWQKKYDTGGDGN